MILTVKSLVNECVELLLSHMIMTG